MNGNKCLIDTSIIIQVFKKDVVIANRLQNLNEVFINATVAGELYFGAYASESIQRKINEIEDFQMKCIVLTVTSATGIVYGQIKAQLKAKGKPIPGNDIWIAASTIEHNLPLYAINAHFHEIDGLTLF